MDSERLQPPGITACGMLVEILLDFYMYYYSVKSFARKSAQNQVERDRCAKHWLPISLTSGAHHHRWLLLLNVSGESVDCLTGRNFSAIKVGISDRNQITTRGTILKGSLTHHLNYVLHDVLYYVQLLRSPE